MMTPCRTTDASPIACGLYRPGHRTHPIQAKKSRNEGQHWVDALATFDVGGVIGLRLWGSGDLITAWHHTALGGWIADGTPVQLNEELQLLRVQRTLVCIALDNS